MVVYVANLTVCMFCLVVLLKDGLHVFLVELYQAYLYSYDDFRSRLVRSGAAWRRSPHQKSAGRDQKKKKRRREGRKEREKRKEEKEKRNEKKERKGEESKRERCIRPMGVKHPLRTVKRYKTHETRGGWKSFKKAGREEEETEMARGNIVTENRLRCENIGSVFYSSIKPRVLNHIYHSWTFCQFFSSCQKRGYHRNGDPFFVSEYSVTKKYASNRAN